MEKEQKQREIRMESRETIRLLQSRKSMRVFEEREIPETVKQEICPHRSGRRARAIWRSNDHRCDGYQAEKEAFRHL